MYNFKKSLISLFGLLLLIGVVSAITPFTGYGQQSPEAVAATQNVFVTNPSTNPVQTKIVNGIAAPVPTKILNPATAPVLTRDIDDARASNIVTLSRQDQSRTFTRVSSSGVKNSNEFIVPAGQALIVTDVEWQALCASNCDSNAPLILFIGENFTFGNIVYNSVLKVEQGKNVAASETMRTGFAVAAGKVLRMIDAPYVSLVVLHGYLVPAS